MKNEYRISNIEYRRPNTGCRFGFRNSDFRFRNSDFRFRGPNTEYRILNGAGFFNRELVVSLDSFQGLCGLPRESRHTFLNRLP